MNPIIFERSIGGIYRPLNFEHRKNFLEFLRRSGNYDRWEFHPHRLSKAGMGLAKALAKHHGYKIEVQE